MNYWQGKKAVFLGDSITQGMYTPITGYPMKQMDIKYCDIACKILGLEIKNYGMSGTCICPNTIQLPENAFIRRHMDMDDDADLVCVLGGTNDYGTDVTLGTSKDSDENTFYGALNILCNDLSKKYSKKTIVFITPLYRLCNKNNNGNTLQQFRDAIVKIAKEKFGFYVIDGLSLGLDQNTPNLTELLFDGLHPTPPAHKIIGENLVKKIKSIL